MNDDSHQKVRVLAFHRYFWPDTAPYAAILRALTAHWTEAGVAVEVVAGRPSYKSGVALARSPRSEYVDGVAVRRLRIGADGAGVGRVMRMVWFSLLAAWRVLVGPRVDVVMCSTVPQVLLGWFVSAAAGIRGTPFVYHCMDLHPEIGAISGEFAHPIVFRSLMRLDTATCRRARAIVVLSGDMKAALIRRDPSLSSKVVVINNFDLPDFGLERVDDQAEPLASDRLRVLFAGNVGRFQNLELLLEALLGEDPRLDEIELRVMGEGAAKGRLVARQQAAPENRQRRVSFLDHAPIPHARKEMRSADVGLVSLAPDVVAFAYPSKVATYLSEGLPVLLAVENSELLRDLDARGVAVHLDMTSVETARAGLVDLLDRREELPPMGVRARQAWCDEFSIKARLEEWDRLLANVLGDQAQMVVLP